MRALLSTARAMRLLVGAAGVAVAALALCGCADTYHSDAPRPGGARVSDPSGWRATGLHSAPLGIDQDTSTFAYSDQEYTGARYIVDLGKPCLLNLVVIQHGRRHEMGFATRVAVLTSLDGSEFTQRHVGYGNRRRTTLSLVTPTLARYVCLQAVEAGDHPWVISELYLQ